MMKAVLATSIKSVRDVNTKYGPRCVAVIELYEQPQQEFWMTPKQGKKLDDCFEELDRHGGYSTKKAECHIILEETERGDRFVWCGMHTPKHSDLEWLEEKFGVTIESPYLGRYDAEPRAVDEQLKDE